MSFSEMRLTRVAGIEAESRARKMSKSDVVRERLRLTSSGRRRRQGSVAYIADLIGSVDTLPVDLSARRKAYLKSTIYGRKLPR
jgi:hypothetical protein